jgi:hypothetical protein
MRLLVCALFMIFGAGAQLMFDSLHATAEMVGKANEELRKALEELRMLRSILPICAYCKRIRDDEGSWNQIESYIREHSEAEFSHGVCPQCFEQVFADY